MSKNRPLAEGRNPHLGGRNRVPVQVFGSRNKHLAGRNLVLYKSWKSKPNSGWGVARESGSGGKGEWCRQWVLREEAKQHCTGAPLPNGSNNA